MMLKGLYPGAKPSAAKAAVPPAGGGAGKAGRAAPAPAAGKTLQICSLAGELSDRSRVQWAVPGSEIAYGALSCSRAMRCPALS